MKPLLRLALSGALLVPLGCRAAPPAPVALSLDGRPLHAPEPSGLPERWLQAEIDAALAKWALDPTEMNAIWVGRRLAYKGLFTEAIRWYVDALETFPDSYRLRRHLGHRLLTTRAVDPAIATLESARGFAAAHPNRLEPDGAPGPSGEPRSTTHGNIDYHLALAYYLKGEFPRAAEAWERSLERWSRNGDARIAARYWLALSLLRAGAMARARSVLDASVDEADVIENFDYLTLVRLFRREVTTGELLAREDRSAALDYGIARWLIHEGREREGRELLNSLLEREGWTAFGVLAAEADLAREGGLVIEADDSNATPPTP